MRRILIALAILGLASVGFAVAQDEESSRFVRFVERQLSTPDRQIRLGAIQGSLSSDVRIGFIAISDRQGEWLRIESVHLVWSRLALLRGRLSIDLLEADRITVSRPPLAAENTQPIEPGPREFELPGLPVSVMLDRLNVPRVEIAEGIIGPAAVLSVDGAISLASGTLDTDLAIERIDRPGTLKLEASFDNDSRQLGIDFSIAEPQDGVIANALNIEGRPPITFTIAGEGPLSQFEADINLSADGETLLGGTTRIDRDDEGLRLRADVDGTLGPLVPPLYDPFVTGGSALVVDATRRDDGSIVVREGQLRSGAAELAFTASIGADGVPTALTVDGTLANANGDAIALPGGGGDSTIRSATIDVSLGGGSDAFSAQIAVTELDTPVIAAPAARITAQGTATSLGDPAARAVTFTVSGGAQDLASDNGGVADALGSSLDIAASGAWTAGQPVRVDSAEITTDTVSARFSGTIGDDVEGDYRLAAQDLSAFAALAGRDLAGSVDLGASGSVGFAGLFDLTLDGEANDLVTGIAAVDGLLDGATTLSGRAANTETGVVFDAFRLGNTQLVLTADGRVTTAEANLTAQATVTDLADVSDRAAGAIEATLNVTGAPAAPAVTARVTSPRLTLSGQTLTGLEVAFDGTLARTEEIPFDLDGSLAVDGSLEGTPVNVAATLDTGPDARALQGLTARIAGASFSGDVAVLNTGLLTGSLDVDIPDLKRLAALALQDATGTIDATIGLSVADGRQAAKIDGTAKDVSVAGITLGEADLDLAVDNALGVPALDGRANVRDLTAAGYDIVSADLVARRNGETTNVSLDADLGSGRLSASGALSRQPDGFAAALETFRLAQGGFEAELREPTSVDVSGQQITIGNTRLTVGDGSIVVEGTFADALDLTATIDDLPLRVANLVRPDLEVGGTVSGTVAVGGTREAPTADADIRANGVTAAFLTEKGIEPLTMTARGTYADGTATLTRFETSVGGGEIVASGTVGETLDVTASVSALPLALANAVRPELELTGTLSGEATVTGTTAAPDARFDVRVVDGNAAPLRASGLEPLNATATGTYADGTARIDTFRTTVGGGSITASGQIGEVLDVTATVSELPLALANAVRPDLDVRGTLSGEVSATGSLQAPAARFDVTVDSASAAPTRASGIPPLSAVARGTYADGTADLERFETTVGGGGIVAAGRIGETLDVDVTVNDLPLGLANAAAPTLGLSGSLSGNAQVSGSLQDPAATFDVRVREGSARLLEGANVGTVSATVAGSYAGGTATLTTAEASLGTGTVRASGTVGMDALDVSAELDRLPLGLANAFRPELEVGGTLSGRVTATGTPTDPQVTFEFDAPSITARPIRDSGTGPASLDAAGRYAGGTATLDEALVRIGGGSISARGTVGEQLDVSVDLTSLPLGIANGFAPGFGISGTLAGTASATGSIGDPDATFDLSVANLSATPLQTAGVGPLRVDASGGFRDGMVRLATLDASGNGLSVEGSGSIPLSGPGLDVSVDARAPLSLADQFLAERGASADGTVVASVRATGSIDNPSVTGNVTSSGFTLRDPQSNLTLGNGQLSASLNGDRVVIDRLSASLGDGTIGVTGSVGIAGGFPADLSFTARNARYADGKLIAVTFDANLDITGPLAAGPTISGNVAVDRAEVTVPTRLSGTAALLEVAHINPTAVVLETLRRAEAGPFAETGDEGGTSATGLTLDITVDAPRRIFIRGRGIDAELGGRVRVTGPISDVSPVGQFDLIRGRVVILTQRITLTEGTVTLLGDLNPTIRLVAETRAKQVTVRVIVEGPANDPQITFESSPALPQDEVLAQLLFGRSIDDLSPFQLAQLAAAVAELAGVGTGPSIIDQVRAFSGLDNLEVVTTPSGGTAVEAGRYIADNVYVGVRAGPSSTGLTVNFDITRKLTVRAEAFTEDQSLGLYYEREY